MKDKEKKTAMATGCGDLSAYAIMKGKIAELKATIQDSMLAVGGMLWEIRTNKLYEVEYDSFEAFLGSPEISFARSTAFKIMAVYETFVLKLDKAKEIEGVDADKLYRISGVVNNENVDMWIEKAKVNSRSDLAFEVKKERGLPARDPAKPLSELIKEFIKAKSIPAKDRKLAAQIIEEWELYNKGEL